MLKIFLALWLAIAGPAHHTSGNNSGHQPVVKTATDPTGDNGHPPPPPPPPGS